MKLNLSTQIIEIYVTRLQFETTASKIVPLSLSLSLSLNNIISEEYELIQQR